MSLAGLADLVSSSSDSDDDDCGTSGKSTSSSSDDESESDTATTPTTTAAAAVVDGRVSSQTAVSSCKSAPVRLSLPPEFAQHPQKRRIGDVAGGMRKVRAVEHQEGMFPSHVFLQLPSQKKIVDEICSQLIAAAQKAVFSQSSSTPASSTRTCSAVGPTTDQGAAQSSGCQTSTPDDAPRPARGQTQMPLLLPAPAPPPQPLVTFAAEERHLSLSRPFYLQRHHIPDFVRALKSALRGHGAFSFAFDTTAVVLSNEASTRAFLAVPVTVGQEAFDRLFDAVDVVLQRFNQPAYYEERLAHMSIAWSSSSEFVKLSGKTIFPANGDGNTDAAAATALLPPLLEAAVVCCKIGQRVFSFELERSGQQVHKEGAAAATLV